MVYLVLFEFSRPEKECTKFFREINSIGKWDKPLNHAVILCCEEKANALYFRLQASPCGK